MRVIPVLLSLTTLATPALLAQRPDSLGAEVRAVVAVDTAVVALVHVKLIDGTGAPAKDDQTVLVREGRIAEVGPAARVRVPEGVHAMDLSGHTLIPGLVGMHDHLFYTAAGGRAAQLAFTGPRLYLASGVTSIRTTGSRAPYADLNTKRAIDEGRIPGPRVHFTAPYITGRPGGAYMDVVESPEAATRFVAYWASEGAEWIKAYTDIRRAELAAVIEEAHRLELKVTGHLCSVSFEEAVDLGIDNLEHGMLTATDFDPEKAPDVCPVDSGARVGETDPRSSEAQAVIRKMVDNDVSLTSTPAVFEPFVANRPTRDARTLEAMSPEVREAYLAIRTQIDSTGSGPISAQALQNAMAFEKEFVEAGGILAAGVDPTGLGGALPGFGDQRNYELLVEAGFTPVQAVQIMSANGAKVLGVYESLGSVEKGKRADLVVLRGDLESEPSTIRNVTVVFKDGVGYDSAKLIEAVRARVGID